MDNALAHIHNYVADTYPPDVQFRYLSLYSPFLIPIEKMVLVLKSFIKQHLQAVAVHVVVTQRVIQRTPTEAVNVPSPQITIEKVRRQDSTLF